MKYIASEVFRVEGGKIKPNGKAFWSRIISACDGKRIIVEVSDAGKRSTAQNAYYWAVVIPMVMQLLKADNPELSMTKELVHEWLKSKFLPTVQGIEPQTIIEPGGETFAIHSTTRLSKDEFSEYIELIGAWSMEFFGAFIPEAQEIAFEPTGNKDAKINLDKR